MLEDTNLPFMSVVDLGKPVTVIVDKLGSFFIKIISLVSEFIDSVYQINAWKRGT